MSDRRAYQREISRLLEEVELQTQRQYRLEAAGMRGRAVSEELEEARRRLARLPGAD